MIDPDDLKRQGVQARIELGETEDTYKAIRDALIERMYEAKTPDEAWRMVTQLQALKTIRDGLMTKATSVELEQYSEQVEAHQ